MNRAPSKFFPIVLTIHNRKVNGGNPEAVEEKLVKVRAPSAQHYTQQIHNLPSTPLVRRDQNLALLPNFA
jgi:hypothetical protein